MHLVSRGDGRAARRRSTRSTSSRPASPADRSRARPKIRAMEIIAELEPTRRGPYCGAIGYLGFDGALDTSIAIRSLRHARAAGDVPGGRRRSWPTRTPRTSTRRRSPRRARWWTRSRRDRRGGADRQPRLVRAQPRPLRPRARPGHRGRALRRGDRGRGGRARPSHVLISPGPLHAPRGRACRCRSSRALGATTPILGVCLGHQCIGEAYGGRVVRAQRPMHGKASPIAHDGAGIFAGLPDPLTPPATTRWSSPPRGCPATSS